jgi:hypothetical protein
MSRPRTALGHRPTKKGNKLIFKLISEIQIALSVKKMKLFEEKMYSFLSNNFGYQQTVKAFTMFNV